MTPPEYRDADFERDWASYMADPACRAAWARVRAAEVARCGEPSAERERRLRALSMLSWLSEEMEAEGDRPTR